MTTDQSDPVMEELAEKLRTLNTKGGRKIPFREIEHALIPILGVNVPTAESIRQYHLGNVSRERANLMWIAAICDFYGVRVADVSDYFAERAEGYRGVLSRIAGYAVNAGQELCGAAA